MGMCHSLSEIKDARIHCQHGHTHCRHGHTGRVRHLGIDPDRLMHLKFPYNGPFGAKNLLYSGEIIFTVCYRT